MSKISNMHKNGTIRGGVRTLTAGATFFSANYKLGELTRGWHDPKANPMLLRIHHRLG